MREMVHSATQAAPLRPDEIDAIVGRAGGNPLFVEELVRMARKSGVDALPDSLDAVASAEIDNLEPLVRRVLRYASVLGNTFERPVLEEILELEQIRLDDATMRGLGRQLMATGKDRVSFRHSVVRDAAYEGLPFTRRRHLHLLAGEAIERTAGAGEERADALSLHFHRAQAWELAWKYALAAARRASEAHAPAEAAVHLERAVDASGHLRVQPVEVASVFESLGEARDTFGNYDQADDAYRRAADLVSADQVAWAALLERRGYVLGEHAGHLLPAVRLIKRAIRRIEGVPGDEAEAIRSRLFARLAQLRVRGHRFREAIVASRNVISRAEAVGELRALATAYSVLDIALIELGHPDEASHMSLALELYGRLDDAKGQSITLTNLGAIAYYDGRWDDAAELYERGLVAALRAGDQGGAAQCQMNIGELRLNQGRLDEAEAALVPAVRTLRGLGFSIAEAFAISQLGRLAARRGDHEEAARLLGLAASTYESLGAGAPGTEANALLAEARVLAGDPKAALATVKLCRDSLGTSSPTPIGALLDRVEAMALAATNGCTELGQWIGGVLPSVREAGSPYDLAVLLDLAASSLGGGDPQAVALAYERDELVRRLGIVDLGPIRISSPGRRTRSNPP
jgi:predicted ATPase